MVKANKIRVALYMRVSTADQVNGFGLDMQKEALLEHVERNKYKDWHTNSKWFFVEQGSGKDRDRKELNRMLSMAKKKEFDLVLVWKIDRISRSLTDLLSIFKELKKNEVSFASLKEDIDFSGAIGQLIFQIFGALAEFERETIKMRTEEGKMASARQGNYIGGDTPYGYTKVPNKKGKGSKLKLIPEEAKIVKQIFNWFVYDKKNVTEIAKELNKMKVSKSKDATSRKKNTKWYDTTIRTILTNDIYRGAYIVNRLKIVQNDPRKYIENPREEWITSQVEPTVSHIVFSGANQRLQHGTKGMRGGGQQNYMLAGKLTDAETGKKF
ncbi:MAG: recombinase family protein, partial [Candidatus Omnitrophica bacterium]|nr:recombinase family protein [Candidatus Omnitrophota bacterium]